MNSRWVTVVVTQEEYSRLIGHTPEYVREYILKGKDGDVELRIERGDFVHDIHSLHVSGNKE